MQENKIYVVDDDAAVRDGLKIIFEMEGYSVSAFDSGNDFLRAVEIGGSRPVLLDIHMPGQSGIDVLKKLGEASYAAPVFVISGKGDIPTAVTAVKLGALDFIEKPFDGDDVIRRVKEAENFQLGEPANESLNFEGAERLTPREREVLKLIAGGASNKEAGRDLGISPRTVEVHRARIMDKINAKNTADLVRIVLS